MRTTRRALALAVLPVATGLAFAAPAVAAVATNPAVAPTVGAARTVPLPLSGPSLPCSSITQLGASKVVADRGMSAFTVRQYKGYCTDGKGDAWMNFSSVYVWQQYHVRGFSYRAMAGTAVKGEQEVRGFVSGPTRQRLVYSTPTRSISFCTMGWGKLFRSGNESPAGTSSQVC